MNIAIEAVTLPGMVSLFEENDTRIECGYTILEWRKLNYVDRAVEVAHRRIRKMLEYVRSEKEDLYAKRQSKAKR